MRLDIKVQQKNRITLTVIPDPDPESMVSTSP